MLQNLTNFFNLITNRKVKTQLDNTDLIAVGTKDPNYTGGYQPTVITYSDLAAQLGSITLTTIGTSGPATLVGSTLNIPNYGGSGEYTYEIGEYVPAQGGVIFHRYKDGGQENYLVVAINYSSTGITWDPRPVPPQLNIDSTWNGLGNTQIISSAITPPTLFSTAAYFATNNTSPSMPGWYLPSIDELSLLYVNRFNVNRTLSGNSTYGTIPLAQTIFNNTCWSSRESGSGNGWAFVFSEGAITTYSKNSNLSVRAVRRFSI